MHSEHNHNQGNHRNSPHTAKTSEYITYRTGMGCNAAVYRVAPNTFAVFWYRRPNQTFPATYLHHATPANSHINVV